jgi:hypothetical protein
MNTSGSAFFLIPYLLLLITFPTLSETSSPDQLLRQAYHSDSSNLKREYFVYLPGGYASDREKSWPVLFFLYGHGQRENGIEDLDYTLVHGPLMEAWIQRRPLPFIIISPQLPLQFGIAGVEGDHSKDPRPGRLKNGVSELRTTFPSALAIK